ncbi:uncharacterized protein UV8b_05879 [Ustilaginoidea virens]|uniref:Apple domain-containing protein n=1 Tax=Ustilaginoidea virens TaxID=1159556 RepID=A0A8E5MJB6_USTVR|nr:uncharacterized protein UV8b_05879 [Ustilaginoidea virens]QUC21636.1 hypothetical protein UV8b_05879 [Ustilaginoidea virens]
MKSWSVVLAALPAIAHASALPDRATEADILKRAEPCNIGGFAAVCTAYPYAACNAPGTKLSTQECVDLCVAKTDKISCDGSGSTFNLCHESSVLYCKKIITPSEVPEPEDR